jgi:hypothetical protein
MREWRLRVYNLSRDYMLESEPTPELSRRTLDGSTVHIKQTIYIFFIFFFQQYWGLNSGLC